MALKKARFARLCGLNRKSKTECPLRLGAICVETPGATQSDCIILNYVL